MSSSVVADTSVLMAFAVVDRLDLICRCFPWVGIPGVVGAESRQIVSPSGAGSLWEECGRHGCLHEFQLEEAAKKWARRYSELPWIHAGEAEVLGFAKQTGALALTDDMAARRVAHAERIAVTGSLGILSVCKRLGCLPACRPVLEAMVKNRRHLSDRLVQAFLRKEGEM